MATVHLSPSLTPGWFLALTNDGRAKPGPKTASGQRAVEFLSRGV